MAERHVWLGERHVAGQRQLIDRLGRGGSDTTEAVRLLQLFEELQAEHVADRDRLRAELAASRA